MPVVEPSRSHKCDLSSQNILNRPTKDRERERESCHGNIGLEK